jgi:DNA polymerase sigma
VSSSIIVLTSFWHENQKYHVTKTSIVYFVDFYFKAGKKRTEVHLSNNLMLTVQEPADMINNMLEV